jgi:hypothetical protein
MVDNRPSNVKSHHKRTQSVYMFTHAIVSVDGSIVAAYAASDIQVEYVAHENMA